MQRHACLIVLGLACGLLAGAWPAAPPARAQCIGWPTPDPRSTACDFILPVTATGVVFTGAGTRTPVAGAAVEVAGFGGQCSGISGPDGGVGLRGCLGRGWCDCYAISVTADGYHPWRDQVPFTDILRFAARLVPTTDPLTPTPPLPMATRTPTSSSMPTPTATAMPSWPSGRTYLPLAIRAIHRAALPQPPTAAPSPTATSRDRPSPTVTRHAAPTSTPTSTPSPPGVPTGTPSPAATSTSPPAVRPFPDTHDTIRVFNDQLATAGMSEAQWVFAATHYAGAQKLLRRDTRRLREITPGFLVLHYRLGQALGHSVPTADCLPSQSLIQIIRGDQWVPEWPGDAWVRDRWFFRWSGERVFQCRWGHYLMDLDDPDWRDWWSDQVMSELTANENDGVFADSYGVPSYLGACSWWPCLPEVDAAFEASWARREHAFTDFIRGRFAGRWRWIPNVGALVTTRDPSDYGNVDGVMVEGFAEWGSGGWLHVDDWRLQQDRILALVRADKIVIGQTYPREADVGERMFALGTYLLVKGDHTYINLETGILPEWFPEYGIPLGAPEAPPPATIDALRDGRWGVFVRRYSRGMVLVNPADTARTIDLGRNYRRIVPRGGGPVPTDGAAPGRLDEELVRTLELEAHAAAVVLAEPQAAGDSGTRRRGQD